MCRGRGLEQRKRRGLVRYFQAHSHIDHFMKNLWDLGEKARITAHSVSCRLKGGMTEEKGHIMTEGGEAGPEEDHPTSYLLLFPSSRASVMTLIKQLISRAHQT